ncbi:MAG: hypothetical protein A2Y76_08300 [Planctomycetes bacterium RBG_13_60_9]|nr:MAG: hypothetical protein A2Y76_08300 [Planctomycetes bacterium RBG_13_60_9]
MAAADGAGQAPGPKAGVPVETQNLASLQALSSSGVRQVVFTTRVAYDDPHWYANIGYYCDDENHKAYAGNGKPDESRLYVLDTTTGQVSVLLDAEGGSIRDPHVHYDGRTILFSYRRAASDYYNLFEIQVDGTGLRQITQGPYDDYEAAYLPHDDIIFISTRSKRWVGCWMTQVGTLFRCDRKGGNIRPLSFNCEHDNTPAVLADGRILYTRWEYVDRSQVGYHQLWAMNPDGTAVTAYFGNQQHYPLYIDAKPIPGRNELLLIDSPGHGRSDHRGYVCTVTPDCGPDNQRSCRRIAPKRICNDPVPIGDASFLVASNKQILLGTYDGKLIPVLTYKGSASVHEPVPVMPRPRERILADRTEASQATGRMLLTDGYRGRSMEGVGPGQIKKLLVLEILPKPVNFSGGMDLTSWLGTFMLERVLGTVPVEEDGSAYFEVPAGRPVVFVALDANDLSVKRMQSFTNVMPGETLGCIGCHEPRTQIPASTPGSTPLAVRRPPSRIAPFTGRPEVLDFRRDVQPVLNNRCATCHNYEKPEGHVVLTDDLGPQWSISYYTLLATGQVADGRNGLGNQKPRTIGSSASRLMHKIDGSHYGMTVTPDEWRTLWLWLESGAPYAGTYAALRNAEDQAREGPSYAVFASPVLNRSCRQCHAKGREAPPLPVTMTEQERTELVRKLQLAPYERIVQKDDYRFSAHVLLNMSHPERSPLLLGPLPKAAGGWGSCPHQFEGTQDPGYRSLLSDIQNRKSQIDKTPRFGTPQFRPNRQYIREMKRFGVLPAQFDPAHDPMDVFEVDQEYWRLFWYRPDARNRWAYLD